MSAKKTTEIQNIVAEIATERDAQVARWGTQDHPSTYSDLDRKRAEKNANHWKQVNDARVLVDKLTWDGILLEEVWEALAERDLTARRAELIQVAAVAAAEVEAIDRALAQEPPIASASEMLTCPTSGEPCETAGSCGEADICLDAETDSLEDEK